VTAQAAVVMLALGLSAGCVNHQSNAERFCEKNADLLDPVRDADILSEDQARYFSDELEKTMRYAEDGTRELRRTARKMADAYAGINKIAGDDDVSQKEIDKKYAELHKQRVATRKVCASVQGGKEAQG
jgi:polyhydroxyalkanoate synthesis regulator phasin